MGPSAQGCPDPVEGFASSGPAKAWASGRQLHQILHLGAQKKYKEIQNDIQHLQTVLRAALGFGTIVFISFGALLQDTYQMANCPCLFANRLFTC